MDWLTLAAHVVIAMISLAGAWLSHSTRQRVTVIHKAVNGRYDALEKRVRQLEREQE